MQVVLLTGTGLISVAPTNGMVLWEHEWPGSAIVQPALTANGDVLTGMSGAGTRRLSVTHKASGWRVEERWTSTGLKPYFNDFVVHKGHAFGFDGSILACIDLEDGQRKWKGGRYGNGQLVLLPDQDVLLVLSEDGELALVGNHREAAEPRDSRARATSGTTRLLATFSGAQRRRDGCPRAVPRRPPTRGFALPRRGLCVERATSEARRLRL